jgi:hypothetical protein
MKDPSGNPAPAGGFKTGGWYSGYQYWNGTFAPQAGQIHPASTQQGAGQAVSPEVNAQTSVAAGLAPGANQAYVDAQNAKPVVNPSVVATPSTPSATGTTGATGMGVTMPETPTLDLQGLYKSLQETSGVKGLQDQYLQQEKDFITAKGKINDNPFLSEATRVGREAKLTTLFNERTANVQKEIAMKQADTEMQVNLATKQFDINSQVAKDNFTKFNSLLEMGALDNASGEDIANIVRSTGIPSSLIQSAIDASKKSRQKDVETQVIQSTADNGEVTISVINKSTGEIISQQSLGRIGNVQSGSGSTDKELTTTQIQELTPIARTKTKEVDTNNDKLLSQAEYSQAVWNLVEASKYLTQEQAAQLITQAMTDLGYQSWTP